MNKLKMIRERKNISQKQLAEKIGITPQRYNQYERARRQLPIDIAIKISKELDVSLDSIFLENNLTDC